MASFFDLAIDNQKQRDATKLQAKLPDPNITTLTTQDALERMKSPEFIGAVKRYGKYAEPKQNLTIDGSLFERDWDNISDADALEWFYQDRSWATYNTVGILDEIKDVWGADSSQLADYKYLQDTWNALPYFWNDPNRERLGEDNTFGSFGDWLIDAGGALLFDPVNMVGFGTGKAAAVSTMHEALKLALKGKMAKEINKQILNKVAKDTFNQGLKTGMWRGAKLEGAYAGAIGLAHSYGVQQAQILGGVQSEFDFKQMGYGALAGTLFGGAFGGAFGGLGFVLTHNTIKTTTIKNLAHMNKYGMDELTGRVLFDDLVGQVTQFKGGKRIVGERDTGNYYNGLSAQKLGEHITISKKTQPLHDMLDERSSVENGTRDLKARVDKDATPEDRTTAKKLGTRIKKELKKITESGGFSFNVRTMKKAENGYATAVTKKTEYEIGEDDLDDLILNYVLDMKAYQGLLDDIVPGLDLHVGGWADTKTKKISLDISYVFKNEEDAIYAATAGINVQDAIGKLGAKGKYLGDVPTGKDGKLLPDGALEKLKKSGRYDEARHNLFKNKVKEFEDFTKFYNPDLYLNTLLKKKEGKGPVPKNSGESPVNYETQAFKDRSLEDHVEFLKNAAARMDDFDIAKITDDDLKAVAIDRWGDDWPGVKELLEKEVKSPLERKVITLLLAHDNHTLTLVDNILVATRELNSINLTGREQLAIMHRLDGMLSVLNDAMQLRAKIGYLAGRTLQSFQTKRTINEATKFDIAKLLKEELKDITELRLPEDGADDITKHLPGRLFELSQAQKNKLEFYKSIGKLDDMDEVADALGRVKKADGWDLANEYVNNNLLSSPDTHELNIISSLGHMHTKPLMKLIRAAYLAKDDKARAMQAAREAVETFVRSYYYLWDGARHMSKSFIKGRAILDEYQNKFDGTIRQNVLAKWANMWIDTIFGDYTITKPVKWTLKRGVDVVTLPYRALMAGDEFLKVTSYKAKAHAQVTTLIQREHPDAIGNKEIYKKLHKDYMKNYIDDDGHAIAAANTAHADKLTFAEKSEADDPLHYAREITYTNPATSTDPLTGKDYSGITGFILSQTNKHKWLRLLGLHFVNTPSNLIRWQLHHQPLGVIPLFRHFQLDYMLRKNKAGQYLNPEAAAEAKARITAGGLIWGAAVWAAMSDKVTDGGSKDYKLNRQRRAATGWQEYSLKMGEGEYVSLNRADPFAFPFLLAADMVAIIKDYGGTDELPLEVEQKMQETASAGLTSIMRNLTSKFYTVGIYEMIDAVMGTGQSQWSNPDRKFETITARFGQKFIPLNGALKYAAKVQDPYERDLVTLHDKLLETANAFEGRNRIMPLRNIFGNPVDRREGWMFGFGIPSSPFASSKAKNKDVIRFFEESGRDWNLKNPSHIDRLTRLTSNDKGVDLKLIKNDKGQTAYDRWMELKSEMRVYHSGLGKKASLEEIFTYEISNPNSPMNKKIQIAGGQVKVLGTDFRQQYLAKWVKAFNDISYYKMWKEYPVLRDTFDVKRKYIISMVRNKPVETIEGIKRDAQNVLNDLNRQRY